MRNLSPFSFTKLFLFAYLRIHLLTLDTGIEINVQTIFQLQVKIFICFFHSIRLFETSFLFDLFYSRYYKFCEESKIIFKIFPTFCKTNFDIKNNTSANNIEEFEKIITLKKYTAIEKNDMKNTDHIKRRLERKKLQNIRKISVNDIGQTVK